MSGVDPAADPSMDDILASIRNILDEEQAPVAAPVAAPLPVAAVTEAVGDELLLDESMMEAEPLPRPVPVPPMSASMDTEGLMAPEPVAVSASSLSDLRRAVAAERGTSVYAGGPTIEDVVHQGLRPLLQEWLNTHLPPMVERLVRAEIERVVKRAAL